MHICYVLHTFPNVSETFISDEIFELIKRGNKITIIVLYKNSSQVLHSNAKFVLENCEFIQLNKINNYTALKCILFSVLKNPISFLEKFSQIRKSVAPLWVIAQLSQLLILNVKKFDHIHVHFADIQILYAEALSKWFGINFSFTVHGYDLRDFPIGKNTLINISEQAGGIITYSNSMTSRLESIKINKNKIYLIPCGVDDYKFYTPSFDYTGGRMDLVCIARLHSIKNHGALFKAISILVADGINISLTLVGDGDLRNYLEVLAVNLAITEHVKFAGACQQEEVEKYLLNSHVHVLASLDEGLGLANIEAMAMGKAVIATAVGGLVEVIKNNYNGILVPPNDCYALADAIKKIYMSPILWKELSSNARVFCLENYHKDKQINKTLDLFKYFAKSV